MPSPVYAAGAPGGLISVSTLAKNTTVAAYLDLSTCVEGQVTCEMASGGTAPSSGAAFSAYKVYGNSAAGNATAITLAAAVAAGTASTSLSCGSSAGLHQGQKVLLQRAGAPPQPGELVTISGAISGAGPYTVPITGSGSNGGTVYAYAAGDAVYLIAQVATTSVTPGGASGTWSANTDYSAAMFLGTGQWAIAAVGDTSQAVAVVVSVDRLTGYA